ncbi:hypothetical protein F5148DRAFT_1373789 [Russula earlei]|uniref:Uncharacterized protein n=1 Tax=Russula earlei TaxID=71964 RepID=A0ACC0UK98_9AGAM|nr:hypothetical protein F5148DRAFT_1373789 [Russula earlei]
MIIPDDDNPSVRKDDGSAQQHASPAIPESAAVLEREEPAGRRFVRAFLVAVAIWVLAGIFVSSTIDTHRSIHWVWSPRNAVKGFPDNPTIEDGNIDSCVPWTSVPGREHPRLPLAASGSWSRASVDLPAYADALYLIARGALASGNLYVSESRATENVSVTVFVNRRGAEALSRASVCRLSRKGGEAGVGVFAPRKRHIPWPLPGGGLRFVVQVELPTRGDAVRYVPSFRVDMPLFAMTMGNLSAFRFGDVALKSSNSPVAVERVVANALTIRAMNGAIKGNFNTTDSLTIVTTNGPVSVRVGAENGGSEKSTNVLIQTSNALVLSLKSLFDLLSNPLRLIEADISLTSKSSSGTGGTFNIRTHTSNGPINIVYDDSPVDSILNFDAQSTNAPVGVTLHQAYEGAFSLETTNSKAVLDRSRHVEDPSGQGRGRMVTTNSVKTQFVNGKIAWFPSSRDRRAGSVDIGTTNAFVKLSI